MTLAEKTIQRLEIRIDESSRAICDRMPNRNNAGEANWNCWRREAIRWHVSALRKARLELAALQ